MMRKINDRTLEQSSHHVILPGNRGKARDYGALHKGNDIFHLSEGQCKSLMVECLEQASQ